MRGAATSVFRSRPFNKAVGILGAGTFINIVEFVLKLFLGNDFTADAIDLVDILISLCIEGTLTELLLKALHELEKVKYGIETREFF